MKRLLLALCLSAAPALAEDARAPHPPRGQGEHCVADTDFMRRNHMSMMTEHRREAVHNGARKPQYSLSGCVSCHAVKGDDGKPISYADDKHFCRSCHSYAAVRIDCFECHKSTPDAPHQFSARHENAQEIAAYLREVKP
jgi:hypothetical protein